MDNQEEQSRAPDTDQVFKGIACGVAAFFLLAVMTAGVKILAQTHHVIEIAFYRNGIAALPMLFFIIAKRRYDLLKAKKKRLLTGRVVVGCTGLVFTFAAIDHLPLSDATVIFMAATLIVPIMAMFILGEKTGIHRWLAIIIGFIGVFIAAAPTGQVALLGVILALITAFFHAAVHIFLRLLKEEHPFTVTFYFLAGSAALLLPFLPFLGNMPTQAEWPLFIGIGILGGLAQYCLTMALKYAPAAVIAPFNYTGLLWATGLDILIWHYVPSWPVFAGAALIISAKLYIMHRERLHQKQKNNKNLTVSMIE